MFCLSNCVPMHCQLRRHVLPAASGRGRRRVATQFGGHRVPCYFLWWVSGG